jgi:hypothetical protein
LYLLVSSCIFLYLLVSSCIYVHSSQQGAVGSEFKIDACCSQTWFARIRIHGIKKTSETSSSDKLSVSEPLTVQPMHAFFLDNPVLIDFAGLCLSDYHLRAWANSAGPISKSLLALHKLHTYLYNPLQTLMILDAFDFDSGGCEHCEIDFSDFLNVFTCFSFCTTWFAKANHLRSYLSPNVSIAESLEHATKADFDIFST